MKSKRHVLITELMLYISKGDRVQSIQREAVPLCIDLSELLAVDDDTPE